MILFAKTITVFLAVAVVIKVLAMAVEKPSWTSVFDTLTWGGFVTWGFVSWAQL
jgi:hypothetical protein